VNTNIVFFKSISKYLYKNKTKKKFVMNYKEQVMGLVRHALTFIGGVLIAKGLANDGQVVEMIGSVVTFVGTIWSVLNKRA
jgi:hypothetical protein